jgi:hypothetical protein
MKSLKRRALSFQRKVLFVTAITLAATPLACSHPKQGRLRKEYRETASLAIDALQKASQFRDSAAELFDPRFADLQNDNNALQAVTNQNDPAEHQISGQIVRCAKDLQSHRETFARNDLQLTEQSAAIIDTCIATAKMSFQTAD